MATVDSLDIQISSSAQQANKAIDSLIKNLGKLSNSLKLDTSNLANIGKNIDLSGVTNGVKSMQSQMHSAGRSMEKSLKNVSVVADSTLKNIGNSFQIDGVSKDVQKQFENLTKNLEGAIASKKDLETLEATDTEVYRKTVEDIEKYASKLQNLKSQIAEIQTKNIAPTIDSSVIKNTETFREKLEGIIRSTKELSQSGQIVGVLQSLKYGFAQMAIPFTSPDISNIADDAETSNRKIAELNDRLTDLQYHLKKLKNEGFGFGFKDYDETVTEITKINGQIKEYEKNLTNLGGVASTTKSKLAEFNSSVTNFTSGIKKGISKISIFSKSLLGLNKSAKGFNGSLKGGITTLLKYGFGIRSIYFAVNRLRSAIKEGFKNLVQYSDDVNASVSLLHNSLNQTKNALAAMIAPVLNAVAPALNSLIQLFIRATNAINQFFSTLTGHSTWIRAKTLTDDYAASLNKANGAAKKLYSTVLGIDELNINAGDNDGGGGGNLETAAEDMFETVDVDTDISDFAKRLKEMWENADFTELGRKIGEKLKNALENIPWESIFEVAKKLGKSLATFLNGLISPELFAEIGKTLANALNTAIYAALSFGEEFDWENLGLSIAAGINSFFETTNFETLAETINVWIKGALNAAATLLKETEFENIGNKIGELIKGINWTEALNGLGDLIWEAIKSAIYLWKGAFDTAPVETLIATALATMQLAGINIVPTITIAAVTWVVAFDAGKSLGAALFPEDEEIYLNFKWFGDDGFFDTISSDWESALDGLTQMMTDWENNPAIATASSSLVTVIAGPFATIGLQIKGSLDRAKPYLEDFASYLSQWDGVQKLYNDNIAPWFTKEKWLSLGISATTSLIEKWSDFSEWWKNTGFYNWWNENVASWFTKEKWEETVQGMYDGIKSKFNETVEEWKTSISSWWNENVEPWFTKEKWVESMEGVTKAFKETFKNAANAAIEIFNKLIGWINEKMHFSWDAINIAGVEIVPAGSVQLFTIPPIPKYEVGGFPEDGLFFANHNELVGQFSNGRPAVANNAQIVEGIKQGVKEAVSEMLAPYLSDIADNTRITANKDFGLSVDGRSLVDAYDERKARNGWSFT